MSGGDQSVDRATNKVHIIKEEAERFWDGQQEQGEQQQEEKKLKHAAGEGAGLSTRTPEPGGCSHSSSAPCCLACNATAGCICFRRTAR